MSKSITNQGGCNKSVYCCYSKSIFNTNGGRCNGGGNNQKYNSNLPNATNYLNIINNPNKAPLPNITNYLNIINNPNNAPLPNITNYFDVAGL